ncbi:MAG: hypothetical protein MSD82_05660, partial [Prevotella sp.]|nr:hypothetical protein [Prevotella sp.]
MLIEFNPLTPYPAKSYTSFAFSDAKIRISRHTAVSGPEKGHRRGRSGTEKKDRLINAKKQQVGCK